MLNSTINQTISNSIDFNTWTNFTNLPIFLISAVLIWILPLILLLILGACIKGGSGNYSKKMIEYGNFWIIFFMYFFVQAGLFLLLIFPIWLKLFN